MIFQLVVTKPFLGFVKGDVITDVTQIDQILNSDHRRFVTRVAPPQSLKG